MSHITEGMKWGIPETLCPVCKHKEHEGRCGHTNKRGNGDCDCVCFTVNTPISIPEPVCPKCGHLVRKHKNPTGCLALNDQGVMIDNITPFYCPCTRTPSDLQPKECDTNPVDWAWDKNLVDFLPVVNNLKAEGQTSRAHIIEYLIKRCTRAEAEPQPSQEKHCTFKDSCCRQPGNKNCGETDELSGPCPHWQPVEPAEKREIDVTPKPPQALFCGDVLSAYGRKYVVNAIEITGQKFEIITLVSVDPRWHEEQ